MTNTLVNATNLTKNAGSDFTTEGNLPIMESQLMSIDMANAAFIMESLTNLYGDPYFSVAREYIANAIDSHIEAGNPAPIEVTSPSIWSPNLVVKDMGVGMSQDDVFRYGTYGSSDKRDNLEVVGNFGMGSKSALAISNSFTITAIKDGEYTMATIGRNDDGHGQVDIILSEPTLDPNGVTITIPITSGNIYTMQNKVNDVLRYIPGGAVELDGTVNTDIRTGLTKISDDVHIDTFDWGSSYAGAVSVIIISGGFGYRVPHGEVHDIGNEYSSKKLVGVPRVIYIDVPTGSVDLTPSREQLRMTARTKNLITETIGSVLGECNDKYSKELDSITSFEELYKLIEGTNSRNRARIIIGLCKNLEIPDSSNMIAFSYRNGDGLITSRHRSNINQAIAEDIAYAVDSKAIVLDLDKDYSDKSLTTRVKSFLNKVTDVHTEKTPVIVLNPGFTDNPSSPKDNLYRYITRNSVHMKASEIYAAVNEYNKNNRVSSGNYGFSAGKGDNAEISSTLINGDDITKPISRTPESGTMKTYYEDIADNDRDTTYVLNNPKSSTKFLESETIIAALAMYKMYDPSFEPPNVVLINGGVRKAKYFSQRGMDVVSAVEFMGKFKEALLDKKTHESLKGVYEYLQGRGNNYLLNSSISRIKTTYPGTSEKVDKIVSRIYAEPPEGSEEYASIAIRPFQVTNLLRQVSNSLGLFDGMAEIIQNIETTSPRSSQDQRLAQTMLETAQVLLTYGHTDEAYGMLDQTVDLLDKKED